MNLILIVRFLSLNEWKLQWINFNGFSKNLASYMTRIKHAAVVKLTLQGLTQRAEQ